MKSFVTMPTAKQANRMLIASLVFLATLLIIGHAFAPPRDPVAEAKRAHDDEVRMILAEETEAIRAQCKRLNIPRSTCSAMVHAHLKSRVGTPP